VARSFSRFGLSSQALIALPYSWAQVSGDVGDESRNVDIKGVGKKKIRKITFWYDTKGFSGNATVTI
jgi:hypothetical protein